MSNDEPLTRDEVDVLGRYNAERARGLTHTEQWQQTMAALQARFDQFTGEQAPARDAIQRWMGWAP